MHRLSANLAAVGVALVLGTAGCGRDDGPTAVVEQSAAHVMAAGTRGDSLALMHLVAKDLAIALGDKGNRAGLHAALQRSTVREGKLQLQRFLRGRGSELGRAIGARTQQGERGWVSAVEQLPDLEMYMPIPAQRASWKETPDILVAGFLETDEEIAAAGGKVTAYRTDGSSLQIDYDAVPSQPVLVLYPVETRFGADGESPEGSASATSMAAMVSRTADSPNLIFPPDPIPVPSACASNNANGTGLYVCHTSIPNIGQYEETLRGSPEMSIAMTSLVPALPGHLVDVSTFRQIACVNEDQTTASGKFYNQDSDTWDGKSFLLTRAALQAEQSAGRAIVMNVWEDDNGSKCDFNPEGNQVAPWGTIFQGSLLLTAVGFSSGGAGWVLGSFSALFAGLAGMFATSGDDLTGSVVLPNTTDPLTNPKEVRRQSTTVSGTIKFMTY